MDGTCQTITAAEIIDMNRQAIELFGGRPFVEPTNFANENSLLYILHAITTTYFGEDLYPTLVDKAAGVAWTIMAEHVFNDANKRTGMLSCQIFLEINGYDMQISGLPLDAEVIEVAEKVAKFNVPDEEGMSKEEFIDWVSGRTILLE